MTRCQSLNLTGLNGIVLIKAPGVAQAAVFQALMLMVAMVAAVTAAVPFLSRKRNHKPLCSQFLMTFLLYFKMSKQLFV